MNNQNNNIQEKPNPSYQAEAETFQRFDKQQKLTALVNELFKTENQKSIETRCKLTADLIGAALNNLSFAANEDAFFQIFWEDYAPSPYQELDYEFLISHFKSKNFKIKIEPAQKEGKVWYPKTKLLQK